MIRFRYFLFVVKTAPATTPSAILQAPVKVAMSTTISGPNVSEIKFNFKIRFDQKSEVENYKINKINKNK